jgi:hypothetical protein
MSAHSRWKRLYDVALSEKNPTRFTKSLSAAETAMTSAAQSMLNRNSTTEEFEDLMLAMRALYEHGLKRGLNVSRGAFGR